MSAVRPPTRPEDIARELLLGSHLFDALALDTFRRFFPQEYRDSEAVASFHKEYTKQRRKIRREVEGNIDHFFNDDEGEAVADSIEKLKKREEALHRELKELEEQIAAHKAVLEDFNEKMGKVDLSELRHLQKPELVEGLQELLQTLSSEGGRR